MKKTEQGPEMICGTEPRPTSMKPSPQAWFISDVHLNDDASPKGEAILRLLKRAEKECALFVVLGDLFDWWMADGSAFTGKFPRIIEGFRALKASGCRVLFFEGNHDIHLGKFWRQRLGVEVFTGPTQIEFEGLKIHLEHGDEINREDRGYLVLRWFLRTPLLHFLSHTVPSQITLKIGQRSSKASRSRSAQYHSTEVIQILRRHAEALSKVKHFDLMVTGHLHQVDDYTFSTPFGEARSINLGSWYDGQRFLSVSREGVRMETP